MQVIVSLHAHGFSPPQPWPNLREGERDMNAQVSKGSTGDCHMGGAEKAMLTVRSVPSSQHDHVVHRPVVVNKNTEKHRSLCCIAPNIRVQSSGKQVTKDQNSIEKPDIIHSTLSSQAPQQAVISAEILVVSSHVRRGKYPSHHHNHCHHPPHQKCRSNRAVNPPLYIPHVKHIS